MVTIKHAVQAALKFVEGLYEGQNLQDLALEEVRLSDDEAYWIVTVGFRSLSNYVSVGGSAFSTLSATPEIRRTPRDLKEVHINAETGEPSPRLIDRHIDA